MAKLPYSRVVDVSLTRNDRFPSRRGFGTQIVLTTDSVAGQVDAANRTKLYATMDEVAADWSAGDSFYAAALSAFARDPAPNQIKAGFVDGATATDADGLKSELDVIADGDDAFYMLTVDAGMRDTAKLDGLVEWTEARRKIAMIDSNDALLRDASDTTNIAARHKGTVERTGVFYHTDADEYLASSIAAYMATRNFDQAGTDYTAKFRDAPLVSPVNIGSAALTAVTGFTPGLGQDSANGHLANALVDIGSQSMLAEGSTLTQNIFLDEIHATDWIISRTEEETLGLFLNNARIPFTDQGMQQIASVPRQVMATATRAGLVAEDLDPATGEYAPAVQITVPSVFDVPESQRKLRISPAIAVRFRAAGAVHYTTINYQMTF